MIIRRKSTITGVVRSRDINVDPEDYKLWEQGILNIQDAMGYVKQEDREFILSGITKEEWNTAFSEEINKIVTDAL